MSKENPQFASSENLTSEGPSSSEYVVVARRYRPQSFDQLVGQQQVAQALKNAIQRDRVGHAYLFTGARGVGKTSSARILAKALNCEKGPTPVPCNACDICESITAGEDVDVLEIDGASNRGIEEIRQLRSNINIRPSRARFKIYIIDEVHMFTKEAFNALLKTLEEPPEHVKFIFCTTDPEKIPITVLSRCQRFDFGGIQSDAIVTRLTEIVQNEGVEAEQDALKLLARRANGSMRDSQSLLEQLLAFGGSSITTQDVHQMLGTAGFSQLEKLIEAIINRNSAGALGQTVSTLAAGVDPGQLIEQLLGIYRDFMTLASGCSGELLQTIPQSETSNYQEISNRYGLATIMAAIQILDETLIRMQRSTHAAVLCEMAIVRLCRLDDLQQISNLVEAIRQGEPLPERPSLPPVMTNFAVHSVEEQTSKNQVTINPGSTNVSELSVDSSSKETLFAEETTHDSVSNDPPTENDCILKSSDNNKLELSAGNAKQIWDGILTNMTDLLGDSARHYLDIAIPAPNRLVVSFFKSYTLVGTAKSKQRFEELLSKACQQKIHFEARFIEQEEPKAELTNSKDLPPSKGQMIRNVQSRPLVVEATELFGAEVERVNQLNNVSNKKQDEN